IRRVRQALAVEWAVAEARGSHMVRCTEALGEAPLAHRGGGSLTRAGRALQDLEAHVLEHQLGSVVPLLAARRLRQVAWMGILQGCRLQGQFPLAVSMLPWENEIEP
ncbi:unnamed protein product, partial [Polarella glacialis]